MVLPTASKASTSQSTYASVAPRCSSWILAFSPRHRLHRIAAKSGRSRILQSSSAGCVGRSLRYGTYLACGVPIKGGRPDRPRRLRVREGGRTGETGQAVCRPRPFDWRISSRLVGQHAARVRRASSLLWYVSRVRSAYKGGETRPPEASPSEGRGEDRRDRTGRLPSAPIRLADIVPTGRPARSTCASRVLSVMVRISRAECL